MLGEREHPEPVDGKTTGKAFTRKRTKSVVEVSRKLQDEKGKRDYACGPLWNIYEKYAHNVYSEQLETKVIFWSERWVGPSIGRPPLLHDWGVLTRGPPAIDASAVKTF